MMEAETAAGFASHRPRLARIAYRMLGSVAEAEDIVQDAYLRWHNVDRSTVENAGAFLARMVTRLCLDHLKSARVQRETYFGPWLPEPVVEPEAGEAEEAETLTLALMMTLERLSPLERAAFLLHDVFGMGFDDIAEAIDRDAAACRQLASRARAHVQAAKPRFPVSAEQGRDIAAAFFTAARQGDLTALRGVLASDVVLYADGGGKKQAASKPVEGVERILHLFGSLALKPGFAAPDILYRGMIDGLPGYITREADDTVQSTAFEIENGRIKAIYVMRNPDKLRHLTF
ncbi:MAG: sigma-70 family RNA polymerase sigma factor [Proteobacteria bacterium]|nr:sigma-70 family RNA polymerase sigma factor [Pseudomonadota bacterium]